ncbi:ABC transporter ATP-binding protein [Halobacillus rhizosphaerae]|uniref:ABC transporter ATP-binding protein n=1 Tax=Halobacillus rhizosphaerae TaxID=3064889 RepID=UPI00398AF3E4
MHYMKYFLKQMHDFSGKILYINLIAMTAIGLLEGVGVLLLVPMINKSGLMNLGSSNLSFSQLFDFFDRIPSAFGLPLILSMYVLIVTGQSLLNRQVKVRNVRIHQKFLKHLRMDTYSSLLNSNWEFYLRKRKTDIINILTTEIAKAAGGTKAFLQFAASLLFTIIQIGLAFILSPSITLFVLTSGGLLIFLNRKFLKRSLSLGNRNYELQRQYLAGVTDDMNGMKDLKSNTLEHSRMNWFTQVTNGIEEEQVEYTRLKATSQLYYKVASAILIAGFILLTFHLFLAQAGQLMIVIVVFSRLWPRVTNIQSSLEQIATNLPSLKAVLELQKECKNAQEFNSIEDKKEQMEISRSITCHNIYFRYENQKDFALQNISITIPSNQMTAFAGRSGAGKSTLIDLLMGLNKPEKGNILVDGSPLMEPKIQSLRQEISYVPQDPFLFNTSIRENLNLTMPEASDEQLWEALEFSSAVEFVHKLPHGLDTSIGDRGIKLSGGERQRLVLARAILKKPSILILDEATSALDRDNERNIQQAIEQLKGKITIIVIAHRLSTMRNADQMIVLENGKVVHQGRFKQITIDKKTV